MKIYKFQDLLEKDLKDPEFKRLWEAGEQEDRLIRAAIEARIKKNMSQNQLAKKIGTKQSAISRFESGKNKNPTIKFLSEMARALGFELELVFRVK